MIGGGRIIAPVSPDGFLMGQLDAGFTEWIKACNNCCYLAHTLADDHH